MTRLSLLALGAAAALAFPQQQQQQLTSHQPHIVLGDDDARPLVTTDALQETIKADRLWKRAERLYELAKESEEEYGHPTRVIGSKGLLPVVRSMLLLRVLTELGHLATIDYIKSELASLGGYYNVSEQVFGAVSGSVSEFRLVIGDQVPKSTTAFS
jgi:aminopeptidase Y